LEADVADHIGSVWTTPDADCRNNRPIVKLFGPSEYQSAAMAIPLAVRLNGDES